MSDATLLNRYVSFDNFVYNSHIYGKTFYSIEDFELIYLNKSSKEILEKTYIPKYIQSNIHDNEMLNMYLERYIDGIKYAFDNYVCDVFPKIIFLDKFSSLYPNKVCDAPATFYIDSLDAICVTDIYIKVIKHFISHPSSIQEWALLECYFGRIPFVISKDIDLEIFCFLQGMEEAYHHISHHSPFCSEIDNWTDDFQNDKKLRYSNYKVENIIGFVWASFFVEKFSKNKSSLMDFLNKKRIEIPDTYNLFIQSIKPTQL